MPKYKILFFVTGIGWGDSVREYSIIQELIKKKNVEIKIACYKTSYDFFKKKFPAIKIRGFDTASPKFKFEFTRFMRKNALLPLTWNYQIKKLKKELGDFKPDLVITDFEPLGVLYARNTNTKFIEVFGVDPKDFDEFLKQRKHDLFTDLQIIYLKRMYEIGNKFSQAIIIGGLAKRKDFDKFRFVNLIVRDTKKVKEGKEIVVILGGSSFGIAMGKHMEKILLKIKEKFIVFGSHKEKKIGNCHFVPVTENALDYIKNAKGIISLAGHLTISESLVFKKPLLVFPIPNHVEQAYNSWLLKNNKLALVKELKKIDEKEIEDSIKDFIKKIPELKKKIRKTNIKGDGAKQAAKIIFSILKSN
ncbi:MAG: hypothetical protein KJ767_01305 [Nanoarchaeota archaeon]|nr:hypothetical protein [Nanoarchaeota archaeon]